MTTTQTIDGVSRELLASFAAYVQDSPNAIMRAKVKELRAVLDAEPVMCHGCMAESVSPDHFDSAGKCKAAQPQGEPVEYDPAKENKQFEVWARTQSQVDLRLCDIGLYYERQTGLAHDAWQHRAKLAEQLAPVAVVPELTSELRWILGQMCFQHIHTAQELRLMGHEIARKAEDEQAVTIYWMLGHYLKDPANWRQNATAELKASAPAA